MALDLDPVQGIAKVFSEPSNLNPHTSRLWTQMRIFTPLVCDLDSETTKTTSRKIVVSADLDPDLSDGLGSGGLIAWVFRGTFFLNISCHDFKKVDGRRKMNSQLWLHMAEYLNYISSRLVFISPFFSLSKYAIQKLNNLMWIRMEVTFMSLYFNG